MPAPEGNDHALGNPGGGAPEGNENAVGNSGGGAPEGNVNPATHGLKSDPTNLLENLRETDPEAVEWIEDRYEGYLDAAPFGRDHPDADVVQDLVTQQYAVRRALHRQVSEGMVIEDTEAVSGGEKFELRGENPVNLPLDRALRTINRQLKALGVRTDEPQTAIAIGEFEASSDDLTIRAIDVSGGESDAGAKDD
jgi:hypothetical protein